MVRKCFIKVFSGSGVVAVCLLYKDNVIVMDKADGESVFDPGTNAYAKKPSSVPSGDAYGTTEKSGGGGEGGKGRRRRRRGRGRRKSKREQRFIEVKPSFNISLGKDSPEINVIKELT